MAVISPRSIEKANDEPIIPGAGAGAGVGGPGTTPSLSALYLQAHRMTDGACAP